VKLLADTDPNKLASSTMMVQAVLGPYGSGQFGLETQLLTKSMEQSPVVCQP